MLKFNDSKTILVIYDALEMVRQPHADIQSFFQNVCDRMFLDSQKYTLSFAHGNIAEDILRNLSSSRYNLIILASNAIIRRTSPLYKILDQNKNSVSDYIKSGRSMIIYHQGFSGKESEVDFLDFAGAKKWVYADTKNSNKDFQANSNHPLLEYPNRITKGSLFKTVNNSQFYLCYYGIAIDSTVENDLVTEVVKINSPVSCVALLTYEDEGRLILSPYPADWIKDMDLTENMIYYGLYGTPKVITVHEHDMADEEYYNMLCTRLSEIDNITKFVDKPGLDKDVTFNYLTSHAKLFVFSSYELKTRYLETQGVKNALNDGAKLIVANKEELDGNKYENLNVLIGRTNYKFNRLVSNSILSDMKLSKWFENALIHDIRDFVLSINDSCNGLETEEEFSFSTIIAKVSKDIYSRASKWMENNVIEKDPNTGIIAIWLMKISSSDKLDKNIVKLLDSLKNDDRCQDFKYTILSLLNSNEESIIVEDDSVFNDQISLGAIIRWLDDYYMSNLLGARINLSNKGYDKIYLHIKQELTGETEFFDNSESTIQSIIAICRFLIDMPSKSSYKISSNVILNELISSLSANVNFEEDGSKINNKESFAPSLAEFMCLSMFIRIDSIYPRSLYETISSIESTKEPEVKYLNKIASMSNGLENRDRIILKLREQILESNKASKKEIEYLRKQSKVGAIAIWVSILVLVVLNGYFLIQAVSSFGSGFNENIGVLIGLVPLTIGYITFTQKYSLTKLSSSSKNDSENRDE